MSSGLLEKGEELGKKYAQKITTSQLRKFLAGVNLIENKIKSSKNKEMTQEIEDDIIYLKVRLAYQAGKETKPNKKQALKDFYKDLEVYIDNSLKEKNFNNLYKLIESIVAYHKYYGGEEN